nr:reverse transcriptase domain-containing protein [Tanacetum cinerariifolium]
MSTRSSTRNLFSPLDNPELTIRKRSCADPTLLNDFEMATEGNGDLPVPDLRTIKELCQPSLNGRGGPIAPIAIQATNFELKHDMIQQVQNSCQFHGLSGDDANNHFDKFLHVTQSIKVNGVTDDALRLYLFPHSLTHHATTWFDCFPRNSINTFEQMAKMFFGKYFPPSMVTKLRMKSPTSVNVSMSRYSKPGNVTSIQLIDVLTTTCCPNTITNPKEDLKGITTQSGNAYKGPTIPTTSSPPKVVERETEVTKDSVPPTNNGSTKDVQPLVVQIENQIPNSEPIVAPGVEPIIAPVSAPKPNQKPLIPYPPGRSRRKHKSHAIISVNKLSLPELTPTLMTLELADRSISRPIDVDEDVFVKVGKFHFPTDFVVFDFDAYPRVPLILGRSFLKIRRALIDVYAGELTLRVNNEGVTFILDQT